jgi:hypothetical protein
MIVYKPGMIGIGIGVGPLAWLHWSRKRGIYVGRPEIGDDGTSPAVMKWAGFVRLSGAELTRLAARGLRADITVLGICQLAGDVTPEALSAAVDRVKVHGLLVASPEVRTHLAS